MGTKADFEQWAEQHGLSTTKCAWYGDIYESEVTLYAYAGWEAYRKEIDLLKTKLMRTKMEDIRVEELLKDLSTLIVMLKGTKGQYGLLDWVDSYYSDYTEEALNFCNDLENKYLNYWRAENESY